MRRVLPILLLLLLLAGCSRLGLAYNQADHLVAWWLDRQFDLDRGQRRRLEAGLAELQRWHRQQELAHWQALLRAAEAALADDGRLDAAELRGLEQRLDASLQRTLVRSAPLAGPWLATLRPEQWARFVERRHERLEEWQQEQADADTRAEALVEGLERWLDRLDRPLRHRAEAVAEAWGPEPAELDLERAERLRLSEQGLRAWAAGDLDGGTRLLLQGAGRDLEGLGPAARLRRERLLGDLLQGVPPEQWQRARARWAQWQRELQELQQGDD